MYEGDKEYQPHPNDKDFTLFEPHAGGVWRMVLLYLVNHQPQVTWEYGICPGSVGSVMPLSAEQLQNAIGKELFDEATEYVEAKFKRYLDEKQITDPRLVTA